MAIQPTNKYLMRDYRLILGTNDAPQMIDTENPITPVAVINNNLPTPSSNQSMLKYTLSKGTSTDTTVQVSTATSNKNVYMIGFNSLRSGADTTFAIVDDDTGAIGLGDAATNTLFYVTGVSSTSYFIFPLPIKCNRGIRLRATSGVTTNPAINVLYIEEEIF